jgi:hypothetical protein
MIAASVSFAQTANPNNPNRPAKKPLQETAPAATATNTPAATTVPTPQASPAVTMGATSAATPAASPAAGMVVGATPSATPVSTPKPSAAASSSEGQVYLGFAGGIDAPVQNFNPLYTLGYGGELSGGYSFDKNVAVELDVDGFYYSATGSNVVDIRAVPVIKYTASGMNDIQPFVFAGPGMDLEFGSNGSSVTNFDALVGAGVQFDLGNRTNLFIEGKYNFIFATGLTAQDIPVLAGVTAGL